tara:strand:+ start:891 stop:1169 length:279 start_codon:yes stop_codon:yes gene_type:complete
MTLYAVCLNKVSSTSKFEKAICPNDTVLVSARSINKLKGLELKKPIFNEDDIVSVEIIQDGVKSKLNDISNEKQTDDNPGIIWNILHKLWIV